jgi:hypothetical protein
MTDGLRAAFRRFPEHRSAIESRVIHDEGFRLLCADLDEAEAAFSRWENSSSPLREQRLEEYQTLVANLADELRDVLLRKHIPPIDESAAPRKPSKQ